MLIILLSNKNYNQINGVFIEKSQHYYTEYVGYSIFKDTLRMQLACFELHTKV